MAGLDELLVELVAQGVERGLSRCHATEPVRVVDDDQPVTLSAARTGAKFGLSDQTIYDLMDRGVLPEVRLGRSRMVPVRAIELIVAHALEGFDPALAADVIAARRSAA